ncbi:MAG: NAD+ synthase [Syntrophomonadaceae bacterium]|nr:NAD+ synthase [Syntrophomonadaceae bacterium]
MRITIAQLNPVVGDIEGNLAKTIDTISRSSKEATDLVVFPELFLVGYPPRDILDKPRFIDKTQQAIRELIHVSARYPETGILVGAPLPTGEQPGRGLYNSAVLIHQGRILAARAKTLLPIYDVFDEERYFDPAQEVYAVPFKDHKLGICVCEDAWNVPELWPQRRMYTSDPVEALARDGATVFINISASPFTVGKEGIRYRLIRNHARKHGIPFVYVNQVGGNDELIFDGRSMFLDGEGQPVAICPSFQEHVQTLDVRRTGSPDRYVPQDRIESVYEALVLGVGDYVRKCGFKKLVIGLSGGIDSAVTCCLAAEAVGSENVLGISMPSPYSSAGSVEDSRRLAGNLGVKFKVIPITSVYNSYLETLGEHFAGKQPDITEENLQARARGNILMAFSNKFGYLVLSTGNKSELAVGYCTLYGDMSGGLSVLGDVPKTMVYQLAEYINRESEIIPREIIEKPPSAELRPGQLDQDSLPPYEVLDQILNYYIEENLSAQELIELGYSPDTVKWVIRAVNSNEYKRRQAAPVLKVTTKAFGVGRRMPIAAKYEL